MNLSSPPTSIPTSAFMNQPPLSPGPAPAAPQIQPPQPVVELVAEPAAAKAAPAEAAPAPAPGLSLEAQLVRLRLVTPDQMAAAMREEAETGRPLAEIVVEKGWLSADDLARVQEEKEREDAAQEPAPETAVAVAEPEPEQQVAPASVAKATAAAASVFVRLTNDERIELGSYASQQEAEDAVLALIQQLDAQGAWPQLGGRYVRPDAVVSIDVEVTGLPL